MAVIIHKECLLLAVLYSFVLQGCFAQESCSQNILNTVAYRDSSSSFPGLYPSDNVQWQVAKCNQPFLSLNDITEYDNTVHPPFVGVYTVNTQQLTILKATLTPDGTTDPTAGLYLANYQNNGCTTGASLTVVDNPPACGRDAIDLNLVEISCSVTFANYVQQQIVPIMNWTDISGNVVKTEQPVPVSLDSNNLGLQKSTSVLTVASSNTNTYGCQVTFSAPDPNLPPVFASNAPAFSASCSV